MGDGYEYVHGYANQAFRLQSKDESLTTTQGIISTYANALGCAPFTPSDLNNIEFHGDCGYFSKNAFICIFAANWLCAHLYIFYKQIFGIRPWERPDEQWWQQSCDAQGGPDDLKDWWESLSGK